MNPEKVLVSPLFIVTKRTASYAREDETRSDVVGAYTDPEFANKVAIACGGVAHPAVYINKVPAGVRDSAKALSMQLGAE